MKRGTKAPKPKQTLSAHLRSLAEGLDDINVSDPGAWAALAAELTEAESAASGESAGVARLLQTAAAAVARLAAGGVPDLLGALDALAQGLMQAHLALDGAGEEGMGPAAAALTELLGLEPPAAGPAAGSPESVDEAAAMMVGLEAQDRAGWERLGEALGRLADRDPAAGGPLNAAAAVCRTLAAGAGDDPGGIHPPRRRVAGDRDDTPAGGRSPGGPGARKRPGGGAAGGGRRPGRQIGLHARHHPDSDLMAEFITESTELIQNAEEALLSLEHDPEDIEAVGKVFRAFHTVKGTAGFLELTLIAELGHHAETLLSRVRDGNIRYSGGYADLSLQALDAIKQLVVAVQTALAGHRCASRTAMTRLLEVLRDPEAAGVSEEPTDSLHPADRGPAGRPGQARARPGRAGVDRAPRREGRHRLVKAQAASVADVGQALRAQKQICSGGQAGGGFLGAGQHPALGPADRHGRRAGHRPLHGGPGRAGGEQPEPRPGEEGRPCEQDRARIAGHQHVHAHGASQSHVQQDGAAGARRVPQARQKRQLPHRRRRYRDRPQPGRYRQRPAGAHGAQRRRPRHRTPAERRAAGKPEQGTVKLPPTTPPARRGGDQRRRQGVGS